MSVITQGTNDTNKVVTDVASMYCTYITQCVCCLVKPQGTYMNDLTTNVSESQMYSCEVTQSPTTSMCQVGKKPITVVCARMV